MKIDRVTDVERRQKCKNICLDSADQQLQRIDENHEEKRQGRNAIAGGGAAVDPLDDEIAEHVEQDVARNMATNGRNPRLNGRTAKLMNSTGVISSFSRNGVSLGTNSEKK